MKLKYKFKKTSTLALRGKVNQGVSARELGLFVHGQGWEAQETELK